VSIEKTWGPVPPIAFSANGKKSGEIPLADARLLRVGMKIMLQSSSLPDPKELKVKRVIDNSIWVGPAGSGIEQRTDVSGYLLIDAAFVFVNEQQKSNVPIDDQEQASWEHEPVNGRRVFDVDSSGNPYEVENPYPSLTEFRRNGVPTVVSEDTVDPTNNRPLPVKLTGIQGDVIIEAENLNLMVQLEGEYNAIDNPKPDSVGVVAHERGLIQDRTKQTRRTTAIRGSSDTDTVSLDMSLHDELGNKYGIANPLHTTGSYEKFFTLIAASKWMELANYDEVVPTYSMGGTVLTLAYKEDGATIGEVVITYSALNVWTMKLNRYINDDDGIQLLDDDGTPLTLD
jgi:hypothetical protein